VFRGDNFSLGSVFIKKTIKLKFKKKKTTETGSNRSVSVRFFRKKPVQTGLARFFQFWLGFFSIWVRFGFFWFQIYKTETEPIGFFKILIGFFSRFNFFSYFFSGFLGLISFSVFLLTSDYVN